MSILTDDERVYVCMYCVSLDLPNGTCHSRLTLKKTERKKKRKINDC